MSNYTSGCLVCGKQLNYFNMAQTLTCEFCGKSFASNAACEDEHFVCDICHSKNAYEYITESAVEAKEKAPAAIAVNMMKGPYVNMHGPEHHYLIIAALLSAFRNTGGKIDFSKSLEKAQQRAKNVPGGICGMWGCCGAGVGAGIFISIITEATPLSIEEWGLSNLMTSESLLNISRNGGPRCCKRNTLLSIEKAVDFVKEHLGINMEKTKGMKCSFFSNNSTCKKADCLYYPQLNGRR